MALGYFPAVTILLLLETAKITGTATTKVTTSPPTTSEPRPFASVADTTSGTETTTPAAETNRCLPSSIAFLSKTTRPWSTVGESPTTNSLGVATTLPSSSSPEASIPAGTSDVSVASSSLAVTSISSTGFGGPSEEGTTHPAESTMLFTRFHHRGDELQLSFSNVPRQEETSEGLLTSTTEEVNSSSRSPTSQDKRTSEGLLTSTTEEVNSSPRSPTSQDKRTSEGPSTVIFTTTQEESTSEKHLSFPPFTTETMKTSSMLVPLPTPTVATSTVLSATPGVEATTGSSEVTTSSEAEITSWWPGSSHSSTSTSTAEEVNSSPRSPTPQDKRTSEGPLTTISTTSQAETMSEKHPSSPPLTTETITIFQRFLLTSTIVTSTPTSANSGVGDTTSSSEVTTGSKAEITSWRPGTSPSSTSSSVTQDKSTPNVTSTGLLSSNSGRTSLGRSAPSSTNPTSESPVTTFNVLSSPPHLPQLQRISLKLQEKPQPRSELCLQHVCPHQSHVLPLLWLIPLVSWKLFHQQKRPRGLSLLLWLSSPT
ncbi:mucin-5AC-like [Pantherophis guttatus]|uniref:Mucin-5AC-like n=1 Tax=Pantherophis guttatus TaxID=94885 RepID=A0ABM3YYI7_PANGU|nr:mucin-5AC-like [Pantherophis guttatus]